MKIYVVTGGCFDDYHIIAIYKSKAKAEKRAMYENEKYSYLNATVEEWEISK